MSIPDETLMAFADGTLPAAEAERIATALDADPALAERVALLADGRRIAARAFRDVLDEPIPARLLAAATPAATPAAAPANDNRRRAWRAAAMAAAAGLLLGAFLGTQLPGNSGADAGLLPARLAAALEHAAEGGPVSGTHLAEGGLYCRRFVLPDGTATLQGLACRDPEGWRLRVAVARTTDDTSFQPASADDPVIDDVLERLGAGPALDAASVTAAQQRGWRRR